MLDSPMTTKMLAIALCALATGAAAQSKAVRLPAPATAMQPQAAVDPSGRVLIVFGTKTGVFCTASLDGGDSFAAPIEVGRTAQLALGLRRGPRIAITKEALVVTAIAGEQGGGRDGDVVAWRSIDGGASWSAPAQLNDQAGAAREGLHALAAGPKDELFCVWIDLREKRGELWGAASTDGGAKWGKNRLVYRSPDGTICECCAPSIAYGADGMLGVMWRNWLGGARDMYVSSSKDGGVTFSVAHKQGTGTWRIQGCPMDGGGLALRSKGEVASVWRREHTLYRTLAAGGEEALGPGEQASLALGPGGLFTAWCASRGGDLLVLRPGAAQAERIAQSAIDPALFSAPDGHGPVIAVWEEREGDGQVLYCQRIAARE